MNFSATNDTGSSGEVRAKVLLIAYACEPGRGSEPGTGWNMALGLAQFHEVTVATRANNRPVIERFLKGYSGLPPRFIYIDPPVWALKLKARRIMPVQLFYGLWQREIARALKTRGESFDILHQLTFNSFEIPPLAFHGANGVKVWGPMGGGQTVSFGMLKAFGLIGGLKEWMRNVRVRISANSPLCARILRNCSLVLFANNETRKLLATRCRCNTGMMIDVGVDITKFTPPLNRPVRDKIILLSAGSLEGRKGVILLIQAFECLSREHLNVELRIVGNGPLRDELQRHVAKRGLANRVVFTGSVTHDLMSREFAEADVFVFPSLRDTSGAVVLEAMAMGLPVVCFDHQGAALMVEDGCGIKVPLDGIKRSVRELRNALDRMIRDRELRQSCGRNGRQAVAASHDWKVKVDRISGYYQRIINDLELSPANTSSLQQ
jgi:glycosyltransferase involved in cell wall biosynthesis